MHIALRYFNRNDAWAVNYFVSSYCAAVPFILLIVILILVLIIALIALIASVALINAPIFLAKKGTVTLLSLLS